MGGNCYKFAHELHTGIGIEKKKIYSVELFTYHGYFDIIFKQINFVGIYKLYLHCISNLL